MSNSPDHNKMYNYEVTPPKGVWDKITAALDESHLSSEFPSVLYNMEAVPPAGAWKKILALLGGVQEKPATRYRKLYPVLRYAAAAAVLAFLIFGGIQLMKDRSGSSTVAKITGQPNIQNSISLDNSSSSVTGEQVSESEDARNEAALEASKNTFAKLDLPLNNRMNAITANYIAGPVDPSDGKLTELNPEET